MKKFKQHVIALLTMAIISLSSCVANQDGYNPEASFDTVNGRIGVIYMHGKGGTPNSKFSSSIIWDLRSEGFRVIEPTMPWKGTRGTAEYNASIDDALVAIEKDVMRLRQDGAVKIFVTGHSMGGMASYVYAAYKGKVDGVIGLATGHTPSSTFLAGELADSHEKAEKMIHEGNGEQEAFFGDFNSGNRRPQVHTTAKIYWSYMNPEGKCNLQKALKMIKDIPVLWIAASEDKPVKTGFHKRIYSNLPQNKLSEFRIIDSNHLSVPKKARKDVIEWIRKVAAI